MLMLMLLLVWMSSSSSGQDMDLSELALVEDLREREKRKEVDGHCTLLWCMKNEILLSHRKFRGIKVNSSPVILVRTCPGEKGWSLGIADDEEEGSERRGKWGQRERRERRDGAKSVISAPIQGDGRSDAHLGGP